MIRGCGWCIHNERIKPAHLRQSGRHEPISETSRFWRLHSGHLHLGAGLSLSTTGQRAETRGDGP